MKKKLTALVAGFLAVAIFLGGCYAGPATKPRPPVPDYSKYAVVNNGSLAVQVGPYIYFVNGYARPAEDGANNVWGKVVRGGIYQAKFIYEEKYDTLKNQSLRKPVDLVYGEYDTYELDEEFFGKHSKDEYFSGFEMVVCKDADGEDLLDDELKDDEGNKLVVKTVDAKPVVNKLVTGAGERGGLYIFDNYIYFTSPNTNTDRLGNVMVNNVCFYRAKLDGSGAQLIYSCKYDGMPDYAYYRYKGSLYLVLADYIDNENNLYSIKLGSRPSKPQIIAQNISGYVLQKSRSVYVPGAEDTNYLDDYIYYTRNPNKDDKPTYGNILERVRPDGRNSTRSKLLNTGETIELLSVHPKALFYYKTDIAQTKSLVGTDLASYGDNGEVTGVKTRIEEILPRVNDTEGNPIFENIYADVFYPNNNNLNARGEYYVVASRGGNTVLHLASDSQDTVLIWGVAAKTLFRRGDKFYYTQNGLFYEAKLFLSEKYDGQIPFLVSEAYAMTGDFLAPLSVAAGFAFFIKSDIVNIGYPNYPVSNYLAAHRIKAGFKDWQICVIDPDEIPEEE